MHRNYARKHIHLHRLKSQTIRTLYYCSFCGYNHQQRSRITVHIAKHHPGKNTVTTTISSQVDFRSIRWFFFHFDRDVV